MISFNFAVCITGGTVRFQTLAQAIAFYDNCMADRPRSLWYGSERLNRERYL